MTFKAAAFEDPAAFTASTAGSAAAAPHSASEATSSSAISTATPAKASSRPATPTSGRPSGGKAKEAAEAAAAAVVAKEPSFELFELSITDLAATLGSEGNWFDPDMDDDDSSDDDDDDDDDAADLRARRAQAAVEGGDGGRAQAAVEGGDGGRAQAAVEGGAEGQRSTGATAGEGEPTVSGAGHGGEDEHGLDQGSSSSNPLQEDRRTRRPRFKTQPDNIAARMLPAAGVSAAVEGEDDTPLRRSSMLVRSVSESASSAAGGLSRSGRKKKKSIFVSFLSGGSGGDDGGVDSGDDGGGAANNADDVEAGRVRFSTASEGGLGLAARRTSTSKPKRKQSLFATMLRSASAGNFSFNEDDDDDVEEDDAARLRGANRRGSSGLLGQLFRRSSTTGAGAGAKPREEELEEEEADEDMLAEMTRESMDWSGQARGEWRRRVQEEEQQRRAHREALKKSNAANKAALGIKRKLQKQRRKQRRDRRIHQVTVVFPLPSKDPLLSYRKLFDFSHAMEIQQQQEQRAENPVPSSPSRPAGRGLSASDIENQMYVLLVDLFGIVTTLDAYPNAYARENPHVHPIHSAGWLADWLIVGSSRLFVYFSYFLLLSVNCYSVGSFNMLLSAQLCEYTVTISARCRSWVLAHKHRMASNSGGAGGGWEDSTSSPEVTIEQLLRPLNTFLWMDAPQLAAAAAQGVKLNRNGSPSKRGSTAGGGGCGAEEDWSRSRSASSPSSPSNPTGAAAAGARGARPASVALTGNLAAASSAGGLVASRRGSAGVGRDGIQKALEFKRDPSLSTYKVGGERCTALPL